MKEQVLNKNPDAEFYTEEKCYINELSNSDADPSLSIAQAKVKPRVTTNWHRLKNTAERYYILSGTGLVEIGDNAPELISQGDVVLIPPMCRQRITNTGEEDLLFLAICTPRFTPEEYETVKD